MRLLQTPVCLFCWSWDDNKSNFHNTSESLIKIKNKKICNSYHTITALAVIVWLDMQHAKSCEVGEHFLAAWGEPPVHLMQMYSRRDAKENKAKTRTELPGKILPSVGLLWVAAACSHCGAALYNQGLYTLLLVLLETLLPPIGFPTKNLRIINMSFKTYWSS